MKPSRLFLFFLLPGAGVLLVLALMTWATLLILQRPDSGATWSFTSGVVEQISPGGASQGILQLGDIVLSVDGLPVRQARGYPGRSAGDILHLVVDRNHQTLPVEIRLAPAGRRVTLDRLTPMLIALAFWTLSALALLFDRQKNRSITILYGLAAAGTLTLGSLSFFGPLWTSILFDFILWWDGPLAVHAHLRFFRHRYGTGFTRLVYSLYAVALPFSILTLIMRVSPVLIGANVMQSLTYGWLGINFVLALVFSFSIQKTPGLRKEPRSRVAVMALLVAAGVLPLVVFSLLPDTLFGSALLPYDLALIFIILIPLGYGMVVFEERISKAARLINRTAGYGLVFLAVAAIYMFIYYGVIKIFQTEDRAFVITGLLVTLGLVAATRPIFHWVSDLGEILLYGEVYDYQAALHAIEDSLFTAEMNPPGVAKMLCQSLVRILRTEYAGVLLSDGKFLGRQIDHPQNDASFHLPQSKTREILAQEKEFAVVFNGADINSMDSASSLWMKRLQKIEFSIRLRGVSGPQAMLLVGPRRGFRGYDRRAFVILESITRQAQIAIENAYLLEEVRQQAAQAARLHRQVLLTREDERRRIARDLHDRTIQELVGMNFQLAELSYGQKPELIEKITKIQAQVRALSQELRQVCADLRPPALDTVGLIPAIQSQIADFERQDSAKVSLCIVGDLEQEIPDEIAICFYRVFQEILQNIQKHSQASRVTATLTLEQERITLAVQDNGQGFTVPEHLEALARQYHFGLMGLQEMLESLGGRLSLRSNPGEGCTVLVTAPYYLEPSPFGGGKGEGEM